MPNLEEHLAELIVDLGTDFKSNRAAIGVIGNLQTAASNLVAAINEVKALAESAAQGEVNDASTATKGIVRLGTDSEVLALSARDVVLTPGALGAITNVNNGLVKLDGSGKVGSAQLPSYVDDALEFANLASLPATGEAGKIYVTANDNKTFRWTGSVYAEISASPGSSDAVPEGVTNLYFTAARADARIAALVGDTDADLAAIYTAAKA